jgi:PII-like signaling protein
MKAALLKIYLSEDDTYEGKSTYKAILDLLMRSDIAGATAQHCIEGYGIHNQMHTASILRLGTSLPVIVQAVDREEKIKDIIPSLKEMIPMNLITIQEVEIVSGDNFEEITE